MSLNRVTDREVEQVSAGGPDARRKGKRAKAPWWTGQRKAGAVLIVLVALGLLLPPWMNLNRFQRKIAASIGGSLGRPVHFDHAGLRLLPTPAFIIDNFVVGETSAFGAEPVMRSSTVTATLHISSLWRDRLEFSSISLEEPSVNIVRNPQGMWNVESILLQASQIATAPTAQKKAGSLPRFPYIEASNARVNIKLGDEKMPLSFTEAKFGLWLTDSGEWQVRMEARPIRTDMNVNDTGTVSAEGTLRRAGTLGEVPLEMRLVWRKAQLGEVSRLLLGRDTGWRGALDGTAEIAGTVGNAQITAAASLGGVRREEFIPERPLDLRVLCTAHGLEDLAILENLQCTAPAGTGNVQLTGAVTGLKTSPRPVLQAVIHQVPASLLLEGMRHASNQVPAALTAEGVLEGRFRYGAIGESQRANMPRSRKRLGSTADRGGRAAGLGSGVGSRLGPGSGLGLASGWQGSATAPVLTLGAASMAEPVVLQGLTLTAGPAAGLASVPAAGLAAGQVGGGSSAGRVRLQPVKLALGGVQPGTLDGLFDGSGFMLHVNGSSDLKRLIEIDRTVHFFGTGLRGLQASGVAELDMTLHGPWQQLPVETGVLTMTPSTVASSASTGANLARTSPAGNTLTGTMQLTGARVTAIQGPGGKPIAIGIAAAHLAFAPDAVVWSGIAASYGDAHFTGTLRRPVGCVATGQAQASADRADGDGANKTVAAVPSGTVPTGTAPTRTVPTGTVASGTVSTGTVLSGSPMDCAVEFALSTASLDLGKLQAELEGNSPARKSLLDFFSREGTSAAGWPAAQGSLHAGTLSLGTMQMRDAVARVSLNRNTATLDSLTANTLSGTLMATGSLVTGGSVPAYTLDATLVGVQVKDAASLFHESWGGPRGGSGSGGAANAHCVLSLSGWDKPALVASTAGTCNWDWRNGALNVKGAGNARSFGAFDQWQGEGKVVGGRLVIATSQARNNRETTKVSGTVGFDRAAQLQWGTGVLEGSLSALTSSGEEKPTISDAGTGRADQ